MDLLEYLSSQEYTLPELKSKLVYQEMLNDDYTWRHYDSETFEDTVGLISRFTNNHSKRKFAVFGEVISDEPLEWMRFDRETEKVFGILFSNGAIFASKKKCELFIKQFDAMTFRYPEV